MQAWKSTPPNRDRAALLRRCRRLSPSALMPTLAAASLLPAVTARLFMPLPLAAEFGSTVSPTRCTRASCLWPTRPAPRCIARLQVHSVWCAAPDEFGGRAPCVRARVLTPPRPLVPLLTMLFSLRTDLRSLSAASSAPAHGAARRGAPPGPRRSASSIHSRACAAR